MAIAGEVCDDDMMESKLLLGWRPSLLETKKKKRKKSLISLLLGARTLLGAPGLNTRSKKLLGAPGIATSNKDSTSMLLGWRPLLGKSAKPSSPDHKAHHV